MLESRDQGREKWLARKLIFLVLLIFLISTIDGRSAIGKCCPSGQVFAVKNNFTCANPNDPDPKLYRLKSPLNHEDFPGCDDSQNLTITSLVDLVDDFIRAPVACVDLLWDEKLRQSIPIVFQCEENKENNESFSATLKLRAPILTSLRICCRSNTIFDPKKRDCVRKNYTVDVFNYFTFLHGNVDFLTISRGAPKCNHAIVDYVINATTDLRVLDDGRLEVFLPSDDGPMTILANDENSCLDPGTLDNEQLIFRLCTGSSYCKKNACVRKCCPEDEAMIDDNCKKLPNDSPPGYFHELLLNISMTKGSEVSAELINTPDYSILIGWTCKYGMFPIESEEKWHLNRNGQIDLPDYRVYENHEYCIDVYYETPTKPETLYPFVCFDEPIDPLEESPIRYWIFAVLELISCAFLVCTLLVYLCLPVLQNLHGKTLMCHVASLIVAYATLACVTLATPPTDNDQNNGGMHFCKFLGFTLLVSWIAAFSWLNVMCFDIWWTFGGQGGVGGSGRRGRAYKKRFLMYSLYAWGFSLLVTVTSVVVDHTEVLPLYLRPNVGSDSCWFEKNSHYYGEIIFFVGPVMLQLIANVIFFILTAIYCSRVKAEITRVMATPTDPRHRRFHSDRTKLIMNVKLFIVMGVSWSLEIISSFLNHYATSISWRNQFFYVSDMFNSLQGLLIFVLFVMKGKVYRALKRRFVREKQKSPEGQMTGPGLQDPYRIRNSGSSSTIMSTYGASASP